MKNTWKALGITVLAAGLLYYPALKLYQYLSAGKREDDSDHEATDHVVKQFSPAYRGKHLPHRRHPHNGEV